MSINKFVEVQVSRVGFHRWFESKSFLRRYHRHIFYITVQLQIIEDRGVEFFEFQKILNDTIDYYIDHQETLTAHFSWLWFYKLTGQGATHTTLVINSCENFAEWLFNRITELGFICNEVKVSEDNENASIIRRSIRCLKKTTKCDH